MKKRPTYREMLMKLPEPYNRMAVANCNPVLIDHETNTRDNTPELVLSSAFYWEKSNEGVMFWHTVRKGQKPYITKKTEG